MKNKTLSIFECEPGMKLAEAIYNEFGAKVIVENTILDKQTIDRIEDMGILDVDIIIEDKDKIEENVRDNTKSRYEKNINEIDEIMESLRIGLPLDMNKIKEIVTTIRSEVYTCEDLIGFMSTNNDPKDYNNQHSINVSIIATNIGRWMNCSESTIKKLTLAGLLHDIGKTQVPKEILDKEGPLKEKDFIIIEQHPQFAYEILEKSVDLDKDVLLGILTHHEREDGSGYPLGLTSEKINLIGKILAVADVFDAMTSERFYRKKQSPFEVFKLMKSDSFGKLHPLILDRFIKNMSQYYKGATVSLNNGQTGEIVFINNNEVSKIIVNINGELIDLSLEPDLKIKNIVKNNNRL